MITVPAYFADAQRKATIDAGSAAGLEVLRIINEPTAAALAYGLQKTGDDETVLIYDLGGGTFDVTVARITPDEIAVLATAGDHDLGGKNWDDRIATFLAEKFAADTGIDPLDDPVALNEVLVRSEQAKWALSERTSTRITLQLGPERRSYELTRAEFEGDDLPPDGPDPAPDRGGARGGQARRGGRLDGRPARRRLDADADGPVVRHADGRAGRRGPGVNVDEVVALGAAIQAAMEVGAGRPSDARRPRFTLAGARRVSDVMSHSLGTVAVSPDGSAYVNDIVIRRNLPIPAENTKSYLHATHGGANDDARSLPDPGRERRGRSTASILGKYVFSGIQADRRRGHGRRRACPTTPTAWSRSAPSSATPGTPLAMTVEPVPDDLSWLGRPPEAATRPRPRPSRSASTS